MVARTRSAAISAAVGFRQQHGEFLATDAREHIGLPFARLAKIGNHPKHNVVAVVTEAVVDRFEVVDVDRHDGANA
jgi:hypothetical protein